jgi:hypothetical protein
LSTDVAVGYGNLGLLRAGDDALVFVEAGVLDFGDFVLQVLLEFSVHWVPFSGPCVLR